jgi:hypothetical protein
MGQLRPAVVISVLCEALSKLALRKEQKGGEERSKIMCVGMATAFACGLTVTVAFFCVLQASADTIEVKATSRGHYDSGGRAATGVGTIWLACHPATAARTATSRSTCRPCRGTSPVSVGGSSPSVTSFLGMPSGSRAVKRSLFPVLLDANTHILDRAYPFTDGTCCVLLVADNRGYRSSRKPLRRDLSRIV